MDAYTEVARLLADMRDAAIASADKGTERETTEIAAIVMQRGFPEFPLQTPESIISLYAQAAAFEARLIKKFRPRFNLVHNRAQNSAVSA